MGDNEKIKEIHDSIIGKIRQAYPLINADYYENIQDEINTPAVFIDLEDFDNTNSDPRNLTVNLRFKAYCIMHFTEDDLGIEIRQFVLNIAKLIHGNDWGLQYLQRAHFITAYPEEFAPKLEAYLAWGVEWEQKSTV